MLFRENVMEYAEKRPPNTWHGIEIHQLLIFGAGGLNC